MAHEITNWIGYIFTVVLSVCVGYQFIYMFIPFIKRGIKYKTKKMCKYAVLIPARNEEKVIPHLIASIKGQTYPAELIDIFVIADNCTDSTAEVSRKAGAFHVIERFNNELIGKGYALDYALNLIKEEFSENNYEGYFVFDADNLLDENYITEMNKMFSSGYKVLSSYRNTKNYGTSWVSAGGSLWYIRESRFLNHPRTLLDTSCAISGTGFLVHSEILEKFGGWKFFLLTEDIEFSLQQVLDGVKIGFCNRAVLYDEQPVKFSQSWRQRMRWVKGSMQVTKKYFFKMMKGFFTGKGFAYFDLAATTMLPLILTAVSGVSMIIYAVALLATGRDITGLIRMLLDTGINSYLALLSVGLVSIISEWDKIYAPIHEKILYTFTFPIFMISYIPITYVAFFSRDFSWKPIIHDQIKTLNDVR